MKRLLLVMGSIGCGKSEEENAGALERLGAMIERTESSCCK